MRMLGRQNMAAAALALVTMIALLFWVLGVMSGTWPDIKRALGVTFLWGILFLAQRRVRDG